jgi:hypothetical protein
MAQTYYGILTAVGEAKDANAKALGIPLVYAEMAVGDGNGVVPVPDRNRTSLVHQQRRAPLNTLSRDPLNPNQVIAEQVIPESVGGWYIRELGLYDADGDLVAIANCPETYKPLLAEGSGRVQNVRMVIIVSSADNVQLKVDPSIILATRDYADKKAIEVVVAHEAKANPHPQYFRTRDDILPGGLTQQVLRKKSNAANDWEWVDLTAGITVNVNTKSDSQLLAAGQTVVDLTKITTNGAVFYIGGARLDEGIDYAINSQTRITLTRSYPKNTRLTGAQNEVAGSVINPLDSSKNLADVQSAAVARKNLKASAALTGTPQKWPTLDCPDFAVVRDGSALPRSVYPELFAVLCPFRTGTITQNAAGAVVTGLARTKDMWVGMPVEHAAIPAGATVKSIDGAAQMTLSVNSTATVAGASIQLFFHGYGNGGNAATFGVMDDRGLFDRALDSGERGYEKSTITGTTNSTTAVTGIASTRGAYIGQAVFGAGLQAGTTVAGITAAGVTLSLAATTSVAGNLLTFTGGQVGNEREDTSQGHRHQNTVNPSFGYQPGGTINDFLYAQGTVGTVTAGTADPTTDGRNGAPRVGPENRPRFRDWLPIIII